MLLKMLSHAESKISLSRCLTNFNFGNERRKKGFENQKNEKFYSIFLGQTSSFKSEKLVLA